VHRGKRPYTENIAFGAEYLAAVFCDQLWVFPRTSSLRLTDPEHVYYCDLHDYRCARSYATACVGITRVQSSRLPTVTGHAQYCTKLVAAPLMGPRTLCSM
jgi:hypothetical protein